jgi:3,4-dihydroxy 2-butanone 4-phosphate synthase/GTP cyclohydrolase II
MDISSTSEIINALRQGHMVILVDEEDRENEGDLLLAADHVTPEAINFMVTHARGLVCLTLTQSHCQQLGLSPMARDNRSPHNTAFTVSIEAASGVTTGISAHDRAHTIRVAASPCAKPTDLVHPGHIFPIMAREGGVLVRAGHTEAGCDLTGLAGLNPSAVICEIMNDDGSMSRLPQLLQFAQKHGLKIGTIRDLIQYRSETEQLIRCVADKDITTAHGRFHLRAFTDLTSNETHLALTLGDLRAEDENLVRVHEPLSVLDFLDGDHHRHSFSIDQAMRIIAQAGRGALILLNRREAGMQLAAQLSEAGNCRIAEQWDPRLYGIGAQILRAVGIGKMRLLSSPRKMPSMAGFGLEVCGYLPPPDPATVQ